MLLFRSKIFEDITVKGLINLKAERNFKWLRTFDLKISQEDKHLLTIQTTTNFVHVKFLVSHNLTEFEIAIKNEATIFFDNECLEIRVDKLYPFKNKYGEVWKNDNKIGEILFEKKYVDIILNFIPEANIEINSKLALKISILILLNIADLDGSE